MSSENIQRLSEGYDFIEESCGYMPLDFTEAIDAPLVESESGSSFKVIGTAKGPFQPMGEMSRNNRLYEADHWDIQLENLQFQERLKSRDLLGTIGHHDKKVDDADIAAGIVSHIVTCLEKRYDSNGTPYLYGELEILDTPAGRNLKALYEGGANLFISSRGAGKLLPVPNESYKMVDKNNYFCETFDIVRRPGFLKAKPLYEESSSIKESLNENKETEYRKAKYEEAFDKWGKIRMAKLDWTGVHPETRKAYDEALKAYKDLEKARADEKKIRESEVNVLKGQIEQLAQIVEKVVDSIYEKEEPDVQENAQPLQQFAELMAKTNISEEAFEEILNIIKENK